MKKLTTRQITIPLITVAIICAFWFGPVRLTIENVLISLVIIIANYIEYEGKPFAALGFQRERFTLKNILALAPLVALGLFAFYAFLLVPGMTKLTGSPIDYSSLEGLEGNLSACLAAFFIVWTTAGFGEEIIFRGYFMRQFVKFFGDSKISIALNILCLACFFGFMHSQQGITGQLVTASVGALLSLIFYLSDYDLWFIIGVHGFFNTVALICIYFGMM